MLCSDGRSVPPAIGAQKRETGSDHLRNCSARTCPMTRMDLSASCCATLSSSAVRARTNEGDCIGSLLPEVRTRYHNGEITVGGDEMSGTVHEVDGQKQVDLRCVDSAARRPSQ